MATDEEISIVTNAISYALATWAEHNPPFTVEVDTDLALGPWRAAAERAIEQLDEYRSASEPAWVTKVRENNPDVDVRWVPPGRSGEAVDHPAHYGGADDPYEAIKVIEAWGLGFHLGNAAKYIARAGRKGDRLEDLRKARWYLDREISNEETE